MSASLREDPRVSRSRTCILAAAAAALEEEGAAGVTVEGVAARAGVAKTTVYRLWSCRNELLLAAFEQLTYREPFEPTDDVRADVLSIIERIRRSLAHDAWAKVLPALVDASERDEGLAELCRQHSERRRAMLIERLEAAASVGEIAADVDPGALASQLVGPLFYTRFFTRDLLTEGAVREATERLLDAVRPRPMVPACGSGAPFRSPR